MTDESPPDATRERTIQSIQKRLHSSADSEEITHNSGDSENSSEENHSQVRSEKHGTRGRDLSSPLGYREARNHLTGEIDLPFANIDAETRARIETRTGRTLEASYEGLTYKLAAHWDHR